MAGRSDWHRHVSAIVQRPSFSTTTATPRERRKSSLPPKVATSRAMTQGILNCTTAPAHIMHGLSAVFR
jgi:hypothetical protein